MKYIVEVIWFIWLPNSAATGVRLPAITHCKLLKAIVNIQ